MTKVDLRSGMKITCRNGSSYVVLNNAKLGTSSNFEGLLAIGEYEGSWITIEDYNDDLTYVRHEWDIIEVAHFKTPGGVTRFIKGDCLDEDIITLWKRPEKKRYTYEQLKEILGEEFEIVKEI